MTKHDEWLHARLNVKPKKISDYGWYAWQIYAGYKVKQIKHERLEVI